jgi:hypothetical protein
MQKCSVLAAAALGLLILDSRFMLREGGLVSQASDQPSPDHAITLDESDAHHLALEAKLRGVWRREASSRAPDSVRFYYFHGDGNGLYRYGKTGFTQTHSFDYKLTKGELTLRFRHTGEIARSAIQLITLPNGEQTLRLEQDPRDSGAIYRKEEDAVAPKAQVANFPATNVEVQQSAALGGRLWFDQRTLAAGGYDWKMYQFNASGIDGRGIGWFHTGTFDDWTTEALIYRIEGDQIHLEFAAKQSRESTSFSLHRDRDGRRFLELKEDPRDFWRSHQYRDVGASFGTLPLAFAWFDSSRAAFNGEWGD